MPAKILIHGLMNYLKQIKMVLKAIILLMDFPWVKRTPKAYRTTMLNFCALLSGRFTKPARASWA
jgi:hypothetical protein